MSAENPIRVFCIGLSWSWTLRQNWAAALSLLCLAFVRIVQLYRLARRDNEEPGTEVVMLHHEVANLRRQVTRPDLRPTDRALLARLSRLLGRRRQGRSFGEPETLLRWHRNLVRRRHSIDPSPMRTGPTWNEFLRIQTCGCQKYHPSASARTFIE